MHTPSMRETLNLNIFLPLRHRETLRFPVTHPRYLWTRVVAKCAPLYLRMSTLGPATSCQLRDLKKTCLRSSISSLRKQSHQKFVLPLTQRVNVDFFGHMFNPSVRDLAEKCTVHNKLGLPRRATYKRSIHDDHGAHIIEFLFADEFFLHIVSASSTLKSVDISQENSTHRRQTFQHD